MALVVPIVIGVVIVFVLPHTRQVYDVTNRESFGKIENWLNELETYSTNHDIVKMLVGNKAIGFFF